MYVKLKDYLEERWYNKSNSKKMERFEMTILLSIMIIILAF